MSVPSSVASSDLPLREVPPPVLRRLYDRIPLMMGVVELRGDDILHVSDNAATATFFGTTPEALQGRLASDLGVAAPDRARWLIHYRLSKETGEGVRFRYAHTAESQTRWIEATVSYIGLESGGADRYAYYAEDVTDQVVQHEALRANEARQAALLRALPDLIFRLDRDGRYLDIHAPDPAGLAAPVDELRGRLLHEVIPADLADRFVDSIGRALWRGEVEEVEYELVTADGERRSFEARVSPDVERAEALVIVRDRTEQHQAELQLRATADRLYHQAHHDALTDLPNRTLFTARLDAAASRAGEEEGTYAVLFIDLDRFKTVNDTLGHTAGDQLLQEVSGRLCGVVRPGDTVARLGGDEFAVLLDEIPAAEFAEAVAERVLDVLRQPIALGGRDVVVGASVGVVVGRNDHADSDAVLREADLAMYEAKRRGRGTASVYSPVDHAPATQRLQLEMDLPRAIERGELRVMYQPVVRLADGALAGFEALVRWEHPEIGLLTPDAFIGPAEESGQVTAVDRWVLREACRQMATWGTRGGEQPLLMLNVNCTGRDLLDAGYTSDVCGTTETSGLALSRLVLEITEGLLVEDTDAVAAELRRLQALGIRFCIDDFGTGYSSLATLHALPVDTVKVDRSFVADMTTHDGSRKLVETVVGLGRLLDKPVVAEGIEGPAQLEALRAMGCAYGQGYLFDRPLDTSAAGALVAATALPWQVHWLA